MRLSLAHTSRSMTVEGKVTLCVLHSFFKVDLSIVDLVLGFS